MELSEPMRHFAFGSGLLALIGGVGTWLYANKLEMVKRALAAASPSEPGGVQRPGYYLFKGTVECDYPLDAPAVKRPVVWYLYRITAEAEVGFGKDSRIVGVKKKEEQKGVPFVLETKVGRFKVDPSGARVEGLELMSNTSTPGTSGMIAPQRSTGFYGDSYNENDRHEVSAIEVGASVWVMAPTLVDPEGGYMLKHHPDAPGPVVITVNRMDEFAETDGKLGGLMRMASYLLYLAAIVAMLALSG